MALSNMAVKFLERGDGCSCVAGSAGQAVDSIQIPLEQPRPWASRQSHHSSRRLSARPLRSHARKSLGPRPHLRSSLVPLHDSLAAARCFLISFPPTSSHVESAGKCHVIKPEGKPMQQRYQKCANDLGPALHL
jgi:hypothetical protein